MKVKVAQTFTLSGMKGSLWISVSGSRRHRGQTMETHRLKGLYEYLNLKRFCCARLKAGATRVKIKFSHRLPFISFRVKSLCHFYCFNSTRNISGVMASVDATLNCKLIVTAE